MNSYADEALAKKRAASAQRQRESRARKAAKESAYAGSSLYEDVIKARRAAAAEYSRKYRARRVLAATTTQVPSTSNASCTLITTSSTSAASAEATDYAAVEESANAGSSLYEDVIRARRAAAAEYRRKYRARRALAVTTPQVPSTSNASSTAIASAERQTRKGKARQTSTTLPTGGKATLERGRMQLSNPREDHEDSAVSKRIRTAELSGHDENIDNGPLAEQFKTRFLNNTFGTVCCICERLWYDEDGKLPPPESRQILALEFPTLDMETAVVCNNCYATLKKKSSTDHSHAWVAKMDHGAGERAEEHSYADVTVKIELVEATKPAECIEIENTTVAIKGNVIADVGNEPILCHRVKEESVEDNLRDHHRITRAIRMEHGASEHVKEQPHTEMSIKTEVEEATQPARNNKLEVNVHCIKEDPGLAELVKSEPELSVKEEFPEDGWQDSQHGKGEPQPEQPAQPQLYSCDKCQKWYRSKANLSNHCRRLHGTESHKCTSCDKEFKCRDYLAIHFRFVHSEQQFECDVCKTKCISKEELNMHVERHHGDVSAGPYICDYCQKTFALKIGIRSHITYVHASESYKCSQCNKCFRCVPYLTRHTAKVHTHRQVCNICGKSLSVTSLRNHMKFLHSDVQLQFKHSGQTMKSKKYLRQHFKDCHGSEPRIYICDYCQKTFTIKSIIRDHITCVHASASYYCSLCNKYFKCEKYLMLHKANMHTAFTQQVCSICGVSVKHLKLHMRNIHNNTQLQCKLCGETLKSEKYLRQHLNDLHGQQSAGSHQKSTCSKRGEGFKSKRYYQQNVGSDKCRSPIVGDLNAVASTGTQRHNVVVKKEEPADGELELGPVVLQHMDCNYRPYKEEPQLD